MKALLLLLLLLLSCNGKATLHTALAALQQATTAAADVAMMWTAATTPGAFHSLIQCWKAMQAVWRQCYQRLLGSAHRCVHLLIGLGMAVAQRCVAHVCQADAPLAAAVRKNVAVLGVELG